MPKIEVRLTLPEELRAIAYEVNQLEQKVRELTGDLHEKIRALPELIGAQSLVGPSYGDRATVRIEDFTTFNAVVSVIFNETRDDEDDPSPAHDKGHERLRTKLHNAPEKLLNFLLNHVATKEERRAIIGIMYPGLWDAVGPPKPYEEPAPVSQPERGLPFPVMPPPYDYGPARAATAVVQHDFAEPEQIEPFPTPEKG